MFDEMREGYSMNAAVCFHLALVVHGSRVSFRGLYEDMLMLMLV